MHLAVVSSTSCAHFLTTPFAIFMFVSRGHGRYACGRGFPSIHAPQAGESLTSPRLHNTMPYSDPYPHGLVACVSVRHGWQETDTETKHSCRATAAQRHGMIHADHRNASGESTKHLAGYADIEGEREDTHSSKTHTSIRGDRFRGRETRDSTTIERRPPRSQSKQCSHCCQQ